MPFHKVETTSNFVFGPPSGVRTTVEDLGSSVFRLRAPGPRWPRGSDSQALLTPQEFRGTPSRARLEAGPSGVVTFLWDDHPLLISRPDRGLGVCGSKWVLAFDLDPDDRFYGLGEKHLGLELSRVRTQFWNTDELGEFPFPVLASGRPDPAYASFPVLLIRHRGLWAALVVDNPHGVFVNTGAPEPIFQEGAGPFVPELFVGARDGEPDVWFLADESPSGLVRKIQTLQGRTPLPPVWALGHQQCRWGYRSPADLARVADQYAAHGIPNDGLWLDIDYMDGFRVFRLNPVHFPEPERALTDLANRGHRVVPILDPGLRQDPAYPVYADARAADLLCRTPEGTDYVGFVWPGYTVFPDFSLPEAREFWAHRVKEFSDLGFAGYWIDMNDPATGSVPHDDMLFGRGELPHSAFHNQYALGMAEATRRGLKASRPTERPFVISRSGYLSSSRHTALWTGDNLSNEHHMRGTIALSLNLSVSGMPFNGPDVPGFAMDASNELMRAWYKLGFLFPFLRNHNVHDAVDQEPWSRDRRTTRVVGDYIRLRYKLLPYLYQAFVKQHLAGDPILRPVWYHDPSPAFERTDDAFFVGDHLFQAPFVGLADRRRSVTLPRHSGGVGWYDVDHRRFTTAGATDVHRVSDATTPLFLASPSIVPLQRGVRTTNRNEFGRLDLLIVIEPEGEATLTYQLDDGLTEAWKDGALSRFDVRARWTGDRLTVETTNPMRRFGGLDARFLVLSPLRPRSITIDGKPRALRPEPLEFAGRRLTVFTTEEISL